MQRSTGRVAGGILLFVLLGFGGVGHESLAALAPDRTVPRATGAVPSEIFENQGGLSGGPAEESSASPAPAPEDFLTASPGRKASSAECFQLRPAPAGSGKKKRTGRCEPQSLPFARCRSGIASCRLGRENGPLTWFACEQQRGNTSTVPKSGSILILAANGRRGMPTGHVAYVEEVVPLGATEYRLVFSHTNYDRRCSLETSIEATYDSVARTLDIHGGAWQAWGKGLSVAGFILE